MDSSTVAPVCPKCGHKNIVGALICVQCYALLVKIKDAQQDSTMQPATNYLEPISRSITHSTHSPALATPHTVALYIEGSSPLYIQVEQRAILGRQASTPNLQVQVDFTPFSAIDKGISRLHAVLHRVERGLTLEDLGSSNGTWLNDERIHPNVRHLLKSGDTVRLAQLRLQIYFRTGTTVPLQG